MAGAEGRDKIFLCKGGRDRPFKGKEQEKQAENRHEGYERDFLFLEVVNLVFRNE